MTGNILLSLLLRLERCTAEATHLASNQQQFLTGQWFRRSGALSWLSLLLAVQKTTLSDNRFPRQDAPPAFLMCRSSAATQQ